MLRKAAGVLRTEDSSAAMSVRLVDQERVHHAALLVRAQYCSFILAAS